MSVCTFLFICVRPYVPLNRGECVHTCIAVCVCVCVCVVISGFTFSSSSLTFLYHNPSVCLPPFQPIHHSLAHQPLSLSLSLCLSFSLSFSISPSQSLWALPSLPPLVFLYRFHLFFISLPSGLSSGCGGGGGGGCVCLYFWPDSSPLPGRET